MMWTTLILIQLHTEIANPVLIGISATKTSIEVEEVVNEDSGVPDYSELC